MKKSMRLTLLTVTILASYILSACAGTAPAAAPAAPQSSSSNPSAADAPQVLSVEVAFSGTVESMNGNQWVVDGKTVTVDPQTVADAVQVGDLVKVQGKVNQDGTIASTRVQNALSLSAGAPSAAGSNPGSYPDPTQTPPPSTSGEGEIFGVIEAMTDTTVTIGGVVYQLTNFSEVKGLLAVGVEVKIHYVTNPDGTLTIREIELRPSGGGDDNANGNTNINSNGNSNDNTNVNDNGNGNGSDDNTNVNNNGNDNDDDSGNSNSNGNDNGSDDSGGGNGNGNDSGGNSNGNGDD